MFYRYVLMSFDIVFLRTILRKRERPHYAMQSAVAEFLMLYTFAEKLKESEIPNPNIMHILCIIHLCTLLQKLEKLSRKSIFFSVFIDYKI